MLPDNRKKLIIGIVAVIVSIIVIILIASLSNFIKSRSNLEKKRVDGDYSSKYDYYGFVKDDYNVYKLYGINEEEKFLDLKTFYEVKDVLVKNKKIIVYTDGLNEIRYDTDNNEFYFYELNSFYSNKLNIRLSNNYLIDVSDNVTYWSNDTDNSENKKIDNNIKDYVISDNTFYYIKDNKLYVYDLSQGLKDTIENVTSSDELIDANENYLYLKNERDIFVYNIKNKTMTNVTDVLKEEIYYLGSTKKGFLYLTENSVKEYDHSLFQSKLLENNFNEKVSYSKALKNNVYYMENEEESFIYDFTKSEKIKLENKYIDIEVVQ